MNQELMDACEFAKFAADMTIPLEAKPTPEAGTEVVEGMVDESAFQPQSVGAQTYAGAADAAALAKAKEYAACAAQAPAAAEAQKTASAYEEGFSAGFDFAMEKVARAGVAGTETTAVTKNFTPAEIRDLKKQFNIENARLAEVTGHGAKAPLTARALNRVKFNPKAQAGAAAGIAALLGGAGVGAAKAYKAYNSPLAKAKRFAGTRAGKAGIAAGALAALAGGAYAANKSREKKAAIEEAYLAGYDFAMDKVARAGVAGTETAAVTKNFTPAEIRDLKKQFNIENARLATVTGHGAKAPLATRALNRVKFNPKAQAGAAAGIAALLGSAGVGAAKAYKAYNSPLAKAKRLLGTRAGKAGLAAGALAGLAGGAYAAKKND